MGLSRRIRGCKFPFVFTLKRVGRPKSPTTEATTVAPGCDRDVDEGHGTYTKRDIYLFLTILIPYSCTRGVSACDPGNVEGGMGNTLC